MMVQAHGHHTYIPHEIKKAINELNLHAKVRDTAHVSKHVAKEIMQKMHARGLTHHMMTSVDNYVNREFRKEYHRQETIKKQNLEQRQRDLAAERAAAANKKSNAQGLKDKNKPMASALQGKSAPAHSAWSAAPVKKAEPEHSGHPVNHVQVGHITSSALTGAQWHAHEAPQHLPAEMGPEHHSGGSISSSHHEEETIDLAID